MARNNQNKNRGGGNRGGGNRGGGKNQNKDSRKLWNNKTTEQTKAGHNIEEYISEVMRRAKRGADYAMGKQGGYPEENQLTRGYYRAAGNLSQYGDAAQKQALERSKDMYGAWKNAQDYKKTRFGDLENLYKQAGIYDTTDYGDVGQMYTEGAQYDPTDFLQADYTAQNIQQRMSPYEELVAARQKERLKQSYEEGRGEREAQALRAGAFGGSGAAIQAELARRNYEQQLADMNAQSLQSAFESGAGLYSKEVADRLAAEQAEEQSRQYAKNLGMEGIQGYLASKQAEEASKQFGKQAEFQGLEGAMGARQQTAAQVAAAKEAQLAALQGRQGSVGMQAALAEQRKNMQLANMAAMQAAGAQKQQYQMGKTMFPLSVAQAQANIAAALQGSAAPVASQTPAQPGLLQNVLGGVTAVGGLVSGWGKAAGGLVRSYRGGGLADLEPQYYDYYER